MRRETTKRRRAGSHHARTPVLAHAIVPSVTPDPRPPRAIDREFRSLLDAGWHLRPAGDARRAPRRLLALGYAPRHRIALFDHVFYLAGVRQNPDLRFFVTYVVPSRGRAIFPRLFYKDVSLVWRSASHFVDTPEDRWTGKGDVTVRRDGDDVVIESKEETTDLPFEMQTALETLNAGAKAIPRDDAAVALVLRRGPTHRVRAYADFTGPRRRAQADPANLVNGGRPVARFTRHGDPASLRFAAGYAPDFRRGVVEESASRSSLYGGRVRRFRILSENREIQFFFFAAPRHVWIAPPQATTTQLSTYGVRTIDVEAPEDAFIPGYEYHFIDDTVDPPELVSQIPAGYVGAPSTVDPSRSDASAWIERLPVVREFRRVLLGSAPRLSRRRRSG
jgi:hypothetical protein